MEYVLFKEGERRKMEEMMISTSTHSPSNQSSPSSPPWKLCLNPLYTHNSPDQEPTYNYNPYYYSNCTLSQYSNTSSAFSSSLSDLTFIMESMKSELEEARTQIIELKAELEFEHRLRKKLECLTMKMAKELEEERRGREATERVCEELGNRVFCQKAEIDRIKREVNEERKMMRMAEVFREERVQMKLADAKILYEQKLFGLDQTDDHQLSKLGNGEKSIKNLEENTGEMGRELCIGEKKTWALCDNENSGCGGGGGGGAGGGFVSPVRRASPEPENPHIKRGIKGSVEFQRVVRALYANKSNRNLGGNYKLECQKAQLKILLKQRNSLQPNNLVIS